MKAGRFFAAAVTFSTSAFAVLALTGLLGDVLAKADFINNFAPAWLAIGGVAVLLASILRSRSVALWASAVALVMCGVVLTGPELISRWAQADAMTGPRSVRIVQFNVFKRNPTPERAAAWIVAQRPDIILLEESLKGDRGMAARLATLYPHQVSCLSRMRCSTVILSRTAPIASGGLARGDPENRKSVSITWARFGAPEGPFTVVAAHLQRPWPFGEQEPARIAIAHLLAGIDRRRAIVGGDFNLTPWTFAMRDQDRMFAIPRLTRARPSWPAPLPLLPIDHVYAGPGWRLDHMEGGPASGSDHHPLLFTLSPIS